MARSESYLVGSVLDGGEVKAGTKNRVREAALLEKMNTLLADTTTPDHFVNVRTGATCESPDESCVGCNKHE